MSTREGNLEAPTRHPVDWKNPIFYDLSLIHISEPTRPISISYAVFCL